MGGFNQFQFNSSQFNPGAAPGVAVGRITAGVLVEEAFRLIRVSGAPGRGISPEQQTEGLTRLNFLSDSLNVETGILYCQLIKSYPLVASQQIYTLGNSQRGAVNWDTTPDERPNEIRYASVTININGQATEVPVDPVLTWREWELVQVKQLDSTYPIRFYYDFAYPFGNVWVWPIPTVISNFNIYIPQLLSTAFTDPNAFVIVPQGYIELLEHELALNLAPRYAEAVVNPLTVDRHAMLKANAKRAKIARPILASFDASLAPRGGAFNFWTGYYTP